MRQLCSSCPKSLHRLGKEVLPTIPPSGHPELRVTRKSQLGDCDKHKDQNRNRSVRVDQEREDRVGRDVRHNDRDVAKDRADENGPNRHALAAQIMNVVVLTAVCLGFEFGALPSSRMLFALTREVMHPRDSQSDRQGVPVRAILVGTVFVHLGLYVVHLSRHGLRVPVNSYGTAAIFVYVLIAISQLRMRARLSAKLGAPDGKNVGIPYLTYVAILGMIRSSRNGVYSDQRTPLVLGTVSLTISCWPT